MLDNKKDTLNKRLHIYVLEILNNKFNKLSLHIFNILLGFFFATALATIPGQTGDWGVIAAAIIVTFYEIISRTIYSILSNTPNTVIEQINSIKIGIIYGFFVDAFKLGS